MEFTLTDRLAAEMHFAQARESLRAIAALLPSQAADGASGVVRAAIAAAAGALDGAAPALDAYAADAARADCPFCGARVVRTATLCGSCWHKLDPARAS